MAMANLDRENDTVTEEDDTVAKERLKQALEVGGGACACVEACVDGCAVHVQRATENTIVSHVHANTHTHLHVMCV